MPRGYRALSLIAAVSSVPCYLDRPDLGVTYDLSGVSGGDAWYPASPISDIRNDSTSAYYDYYLGSPCGTDIVPRTGNLLACAKTYGNDGSGPNTGPAPAFQQLNDGTCKRLGDLAANGVFGLTFDSNNNIGRTNRLYAMGAKMSFTNGDQCFAQNGTSVTRALTVYFECYDGPLILPNLDEVYEDAACTYRIVIKTRFGCPLQCTGGPGNGGSRVCSNHGVCGYDTSNSKARCYCNQGFTGDYCATAGPALYPGITSYAGNIAGSFFGGVFTGLVGVVAWLVAKAIMAGGTWREGLDLAKIFAPGAPSAAGAAYSYKPQSDAPSFIGSSEPSGYTAPSDAL